MQKRSMMSVAAALVLAGCASAGLAQAEDAPVRTPEVTAATDGFALLEKQVEAAGGREAGEALKGLRMEGSFAMPAMNLTGPLTIDVTLVESPASACDVRVDGRPVAVDSQGPDRIVIDLDDDAEGLRLVEIRTTAPWGGTAAGLKHSVFNKEDTVR